MNLQSNSERRVAVTVALPPDLRDRLAEQARRQHRSLSGQMFHIIAESLRAQPATANEARP